MYPVQGRADLDGSWRRVIRDRMALRSRLLAALAIDVVPALAVAQTAAPASGRIPDVPPSVMTLVFWEACGW